MNKETEFKRWLSEHRGIVYRVVMLYGITPSDREDLYQEIVTAIWKSMDRFERRSKETTWIYRVALNTALGMKRKQVPATEKLSDDEPAADDPQQDKMDWIYARLRFLNPIDRSLVLLYLDGNSYEDISAVLGMSTSNVGVKINRIKTRLRDLLAQEQNEEERYGS